MIQPRRPRTPFGRQVLCLSLLLLAWTGPAAAERLPIRAYTTADGLAHNRVNRIVKDSRGFLWFCTAGGLSRFDGYAFANFGTDDGLPDASVNDLLETRDGDYWVATDGGLVRFDPKGVRPDRLVPAGDADAAHRMFSVVPSNESDRRARGATVLRQGRDGTIWVGTYNGLYRLEKDNGRMALRPIDIGLPNRFLEERFIIDALEDVHGTLWLATSNGLYRRRPDGAAILYTVRDGLPNQYIQSLLEDRQGHLWVGTRLGGFFRLGATNTRDAPVVDLRFTYPEMPTSWVFQLFETFDRRFWVATGRGLLEFSLTADEDGRHFRAYSTTNGLSDLNITALAEDVGGNLWIGTMDGGAMKLARGGFTSYGERDGLRWVNALFDDAVGNLCYRGAVLGDSRTSVFEGASLDLVSTEEPRYYARLGCFDGQRFNGFVPGAMSPIAWTVGWVMEGLTLRTRAGEWWVGTGGGVYRFPPSDTFASLKTARPLALYGLKEGLATPQVFRLFEDSGGNVWISTISSITNGLARWDRIAGRVRDLANAPGLPSLKDHLPRAFAEDRDGNVWIGFNGELARYRAGVFSVFGANEGVPPGAIRQIHVDRSGRLWLASAGGGLLRVDVPGTDRPVFVEYTTAQGLSSDDVWVITEDTAGHIYAGGGNGLDRLDPATARVKRFTTADGLAPGLFRSAFRDRAGVLWFGTTSGLARLAPVPETAAAPPTVLLSGLRVDGITQHVSAIGEEALSLADLAPSQNHIEIDFVGLGFGGGDVLRYQYRLHGSETGWSAASDQRTVTYAGLAPGRYTFEVRAMNSDGLISARPATLGFTILRPLWQRSWFVALIALAVMSTIYALYRYRVARLLELANLRTRIATDLHDDIGANLTRIALLSQVAMQQRASPREPAATGRDDGPIGSIARIARESVGAMSDIVWAINPARETLLDLTRRMRQHADEIFTLRDIALRFDAPETGHDLRLAVDVRRDLLLVFKEAVNNAARHSACTCVEIDFHLQGPRLVLVVTDNGGGFDASIDSEGQGLTSMRRRAQRLKGTLEIKSGESTGTRLTLSIPV